MAITDTTQFGRVGAFRFWCQKVLPAVYDDSLSYYELLCKVTKWLEDLTEITNTQSDAITELQEKLQEFLSGEIDPYIEEKIDQWFEENEPDIMSDIDYLMNSIGTILDEEPIEIKSYFNRESHHSYFIVKIQRSFFNVDIVNNDGTYSNGNDNTDVYDYMLNYGCNLGQAIAFNCDYFPSKMILHDQYYGSTDMANVRSYLALNSSNGDLKSYPLNTSFPSIQNDGYNCVIGVSYVFKKNNIETVPTPLVGYFAPRNVIGWNDDYIWFLICHGRDYAAMGMDGDEIMDIFDHFTQAENIVNLDGGGSVQCVMNMNGAPFMITQYNDGDNNIRNVPLNINFERKAQ